MENSNIGFYKNIIDKGIYIFLFHLVKIVFLKDENTRHFRKIEKKIKEEKWIEKINKIIMKQLNDDKYSLSLEFTKDNLINILYFIRIQNRKYAGEIYENILIVIFSFAFHTEKSNNFGKYVYNDLGLFKDNKKRIELDKWIKKDKFKQLFGSKYEIEIKDIEGYNMDFYYLLVKILNEKK